MCSIYEFDSSKLVRDNCTKCMINCYRDSSLMQNIAVSMQDAYQSIKKGNLLDTAKALTRKSNIDSLRAVVEELPWIMRFSNLGLINHLKRNNNPVGTWYRTSLLD